MIEESTHVQFHISTARPACARPSNMLGKLEEAKLLAGGQTLIPTMKLRLASPTNIIDLNAIEGELSGIEVKGRSIVIGAMTRHADVATSADREGEHPGARLSGRPDRRSAVRHRGTHRRLDRQQRSERRLSGGLRSGSARPSSPPSASIAADEFFNGMFETALAPDEIITKVSFPIAKKAGYEKFRNQASRFALVGVFASKRGSEIRVAVTGAGSNGVFRVPSFEEALKKRFAPKSLEGLTIPADGMNSDIHGSAEYRAHLVGVMARRAVARANEAPGGEGEE